PIGEDMAQMALAARAMDLGAGHEEAAIALGFDEPLIGRLPEAGPAGAGFELGPGIEHWRTAAHAGIDAIFVMVGIDAAEGALGAVLARDLVLFGRQLRPPFGVGLGDLADGFVDGLVAGFVSHAWNMPPGLQMGRPSDAAPSDF